MCDVNWNFVGKVESIVEDAAYMLKEVNLSHVVEYPYYRLVSLLKEPLNKDFTSRYDENTI